MEPGVCRNPGYRDNKGRSMLRPCNLSLLMGRARRGYS
jgi:hypothetical protein